MAFLLGSTWLALHVAVTEHGPLLTAAAVCLLAPAGSVHRRRSFR
ncbi:hypothetical protein LY71_11035 [Geodermatophilus tzadiensis]|uniref:Uncharacterized protein n=1 Tax=Geodermatophilus tzadiensis TaxID=1137988 RepID=A0A2T0TR78_9ACTN|nr:hypothetical protein LY71_11035 [Geodermatophilus tzadiensis]